MCTFSTLQADDWVISNIAEERITLLNNPPDAEILIDSLYQAARDNIINPSWSEYGRQPGLYRFDADFKVSPELYDLIFNSRAGYRAQYYHSEACGEAYNKHIVDRLAPIMIGTNVADSDLIRRSLKAGSKITWYRNQCDALIFRLLPVALSVPRWNDNYSDAQEAERMGLKCFMLNKPRVFIKGAFIDPDDAEVFRDNKPNRAQDLHETGWT